jgi:hypothetical protein
MQLKFEYIRKHNATHIIYLFDVASKEFCSIIDISPTFVVYTDVKVESLANSGERPVRKSLAMEECCEQQGKAICVFRLIHTSLVNTVDPVEKAVEQRLTQRIIFNTKADV